MTDRLVYSPAEVAAELRITRRTVYSYIKDGLMHSTKRRGRVMITGVELRRFAGLDEPVAAAPAGVDAGADGGEYNKVTVNSTR